MADDDKKKSGDFSELSDLFEDNGSKPSLDDLLKDLEPGADLDVMQDFSLTSPPAKDKKADKPKRSRKKTNDDMPTGADFDALFADSPVDTDMPRKAQARDEVPTGADFDALFADSPEEPSLPRQQPRAREEAPASEDFDALFADNAQEDLTSLFEASKKGEPVAPDFSADFPESEPGHQLGEDALFDYEPQSEVNVEDLGGAEGDLSDIDMGEASESGEAPPAKKSPDVKRILARVAVMLILVSVVYGALKFFLGKTSTPQMSAMVTEPTAPEAAPAAEVAAAPEAAPADSTETAAAPEATEAVPAEPTETAAPEATEAAPTEPTETAAAPEATEAAPAATPTDTAQAPTSAPLPVVTSGSAIPAPTTSLAVSPVAAAPTTSGDMADKLNQLEKTLQSIDQRLSQVGQGGATGTEEGQRLERLINDSSAPEMQAALDSAVKKMQALDAKLERISQLQQQVRVLNSEVQGLKEDIVTQTNIVGQQQRMINDNTHASHMREPAPVKMMVQAAIPGRAWLRSERGELLTVIPGDEVPGYGRVVSIDAATGTVVTSSRAVFREQ